ncbi:MAG: RtcB family protein [Candidatus Diapherotrites archaeon]|uniref:tRNA-splicing ligase RtcB n=1 Tax=Candidatus Iainarchaeum sp. TaxID=3101447 RepID=A0A8T5GDJ3_9ARCH|nr:RtcB family protein [Candidatus Diapherotrites archaeon]MBT7241629.1 RtcB family protein [Candidatus Diapherotrites archaeon]
MKKIFASDLDENVLSQFEECMSCDFVIDGALMPDAHFGYVAPIGAVLITNGCVVPSWVGYDIGCGVIALKLTGKDLLNKIKKNLDTVHNKVQRNVPMGLGRLNPEHKITKETKEKFVNLLKKLEKSPHNDEILAYLKRKALSNLGSLGHGNHFIEIDTTGKDVWLIIHSGSRHMGHEVASRYMKAAMNAKGKEGNAEQTFEIDTKSKLGKEYLAVLDFLLSFALLNRMEIANEVVQGIEEAIGEKVKATLWTNKNHNNAERIGKSQKFIHRKGATPSKKNEKGVIPGNMRDGTFLVIGKGNKDFLESSTHGAGRAMSKTRARKEFTMQEFKKSMKGIKATIKEGTLDEAPFAYKDIFKVMKEQKASVKVYKHLIPILNWKGESSKRF